MENRQFSTQRMIQHLQRHRLLVSTPARGSRTTHFRMSTGHSHEPLTTSRSRDHRRPRNIRTNACQDHNHINGISIIPAVNTPKTYQIKSPPTLLSTGRTERSTILSLLYTVTATCFLSFLYPGYLL